MHIEKHKEQNALPVEDAENVRRKITRKKVLKNVFWYGLWDSKSQMKFLEFFRSSF